MHLPVHQGSHEHTPPRMHTPCTHPPTSEQSFKSVQFVPVHLQECSTNVTAATAYSASLCAADRESVCCLLVLLCVERRGRCRSLRTSGRARSGALSRMVLTLHDIGTSSLDCTRHVHCSKDMLAPQPCLPRSAGFAQICAPGRVCVSKQGPTVTSIYMQVECACTAA